MRFAACIVLALCLVSVMAVPNKKQASTCEKSCAENYEPICAKASNSAKERLITFGNECVMKNYNCAHADEPFEVKTKGECGGNVSVRLS